MQAIWDRVIVKRDEEEKLSAGGIYIPAVGREKPQTGIVVSVGAKVECVDPDSRIAFGKYAGVDFDGYVILKQEEILCIV